MRANVLGDERRGNSRLLIERFKRRIKGFNERQLTLDDLYGFCDSLGVEVVEIPLRRLHGCALIEDKAPFIYINSLLSKPLKTVAGWHEAKHILEDVLETRPFKSTGNLWPKRKYDRQAQIVGVLAYMPTPKIQGFTVEDVMRCYGVDRNLAEFRLSLGF